MCRKRRRKKGQISPAPMSKAKPSRQTQGGREDTDPAKGKKVHGTAQQGKETQNMSTLEWLLQSIKNGPTFWRKYGRSVAET